MGNRNRKRRLAKALSSAEIARRVRQRTAKTFQSTRQSGLAPDYVIDPAALGRTSEEEALHVDSRDWREVKIQGREGEIIEASGNGDLDRAREIIEEIRANAGGCDVCSAHPAEGEGFVLSTSKGRVERRWGHRDCLLEAADRWLANGQDPVWTLGTSIFTNPTEDSMKHVLEAADGHA